MIFCWWKRLVILFIVRCFTNHIENIQVHCIVTLLICKQIYAYLIYYYTPLSQINLNIGESYRGLNGVKLPLCPYKHVHIYHRIKKRMRCGGCMDVSGPGKRKGPIELLTNRNKVFTPPYKSGFTDKRSNKSGFWERTYNCDNSYNAIIKSLHVYQSPQI